MSNVKWVLPVCFLLSVSSYINAANNQKQIDNYEETLDFPIDVVWPEVKDFSKAIPCLGTYKNVSLQKKEGKDVSMLTIVPKQGPPFPVKHTVNEKEFTINTEFLGNPDFEVKTKVKLISEKNKTKFVWTETKEYHQKYIVQAKEIGKANKLAVIHCIGSQKALLASKKK